MGNLINIDINFTTTRRMIIILLILAVLDIITGFIKARVKKDISSTKMREGLFKKCLELILVLVGYLIDILIQTQIVVRVITIFYCIEEIISILENTAEYCPYPKVLTNLLKQIKGKIGEDENGTTKQSKSELSNDSTE